MAEKRLEVLITGNAKSAQKAFGDLDKAAARSAKEQKKAFSDIQRGIVGLGVGTTLWKASQSASDLAESQAKVGQVFGDSADEVEKFAQSAARSLGQSEQQALEAAGTFGNLVTSFGVGDDKAKDMSVTLTKLASDLASFNNTSVQDAIDALRSGLSGETEPLKRYGIALDDASLKAEALALGIADGTATLTPAQKAQAGYALILERSTTAQGDFARTSEGAANQQKIAAAEYENAKAALGEGLQPALISVMGVAADAAQTFAELPDPVRNGALAVAGLGTAAIVAGPRVASMVSTLSDASAAVKKFADTSPLAQKAGQTIGSAVGAIGGLPAVTALGATGLGVLAAGFINAEIKADRAKANIGDLQKLIAGGFTPGEAAAKKLTNTLAGVDGGFAGLKGSSKDLRNDLDELGISATEAAGYISMPADEWKKMRQELLDNPVGDHPEDIFNLVDNLDLMRGAMRDASEQDKVLKGTQQELVAAGIIPASEATGINTEKTKQATSATRGWLGSNRNLIDSFQDRITKQDEINAGLQTAIDLAYASVDSNLALKAAHDSVQDAQMSLGEARTSGDVEQIQRAEDELTAAIMRESQAAVEAARTSAEAQGKSLSAADAANIQRMKLAELATQTGFTSDELIWLRANLDNAAKETKVKLDTAEARNNIDLLINKLAELGITGTGKITGVAGDLVAAGIGEVLGTLQPAGKATGGPVKAGGFNLVGERGPELVQWGADGTVIPAHKTKQMLSGTSVNAGSRGYGGAVTNVFHITESKDAEATANAVAAIFRRQSRLGMSPLAGVG